MTTVEMIEQMNAHAPPALKVLGGKVVSFDEETGIVEMHYDVNETLCHSGDIVQGGFLAGMLDAAMAHAVFAVLKEFVIVATLEIKVSYLDIARPGTIVGRGWITRMGKTISFLEGELQNSEGLVLARASSTARIIHRRPGK
jgi:acyl-CoA thioesterase